MTHSPALPQAMPFALVQPSTSVPIGNSRQLPTEPSRLHDRHGPAQAASQHTPCSQYPLAHPAPVMQRRPLQRSEQPGSLVQLLQSGTHSPAALHTWFGPAEHGFATAISWHLLMSPPGHSPITSVVHSSPSSTPSQMQLDPLLLLLLVLLELELVLPVVCPGRSSM